MKHSEIYSASYVDFQDEGNNIYRISIRSHNIGAGTPQAVIYTFFTGKDDGLYNKIYNQIKSYEYEPIPIRPYKKNKL